TLFRSAGEVALRLLEARARGATDVEADLPRVDRREEVAPDERDEPARERHEDEEEPRGRRPVLERPGEEAGVARAERLERVVEALVDPVERARRPHAARLALDLGREEVLDH